MTTRTLHHHRPSPNTPLFVLLLACWCAVLCSAGKDKPTSAPVAMILPNDPGAPPGQVPPPPPIVTIEPTIGPPDKPNKKPADAPSLRPSNKTPDNPATDDNGSDDKGDVYQVNLPLMELNFELLSSPESSQSSSSTSSSTSTADSSSNLPTQSTMQTTLEGFLKDFLSQNSANRQSFQGVRLTVDQFTLSSIDQNYSSTTSTRRDERRSRRQLSTLSSSSTSSSSSTATPNPTLVATVDLECSGQAEFTTAPTTTASSSNGTSASSNSTVIVTEEDLTKMIITYLSFWGVQDLQEYLYKSQGWFVHNVTMAINGDVVQPAPTSFQDDNDGGAGAGDDKDKEPDAGGDSGGTDSSSNASQGDDNSSDSSTRRNNIVVITVVSIVAILLLALAIWIVIMGQRRRSKYRTDQPFKHRELDSDVGDDDIPDDGYTHESYSPQHSNDAQSPIQPSLPYNQLRIVGPASLSSASGSPARGRALSPSSFAMADDVISYSGVVSVEDSMFTTSNNVTSNTTMNDSSADGPSFTYDASRLDHVISSAKGVFTERNDIINDADDSKQQDSSAVLDDDESNHSLPPAV